MESINYSRPLLSSYKLKKKLDNYNINTLTIHNILELFKNVYDSKDISEIKLFENNIGNYITITSYLSKQLFNNLTIHIVKLGDIKCFEYLMNESVFSKKERSDIETIEKIIKKTFECKNIKFLEYISKLYKDGHSLKTFFELLFTLNNSKFINEYIDSNKEYFDNLIETKNKTYDIMKNNLVKNGNAHSIKYMEENNYIDMNEKTYTIIGFVILNGDFENFKFFYNNYNKKFMELFDEKLLFASIKHYKIFEYLVYKFLNYIDVFKKYFIDVRYLNINTIKLLLSLKVFKFDDKIFDQYFGLFAQYDMFDEMKYLFEINENLDICYDEYYAYVCAMKNGNDEMLSWLLNINSKIFDEIEHDEFLKEEIIENSIHSGNVNIVKLLKDKNLLTDFDFSRINFPYLCKKEYSSMLIYLIDNWKINKQIIHKKCYLRKFEYSLEIRELLLNI